MKLLDSIIYKGANIKLYMLANVTYKVTIKLPHETRATRFEYNENIRNKKTERESALDQAKEYVDSYQDEMKKLLSVFLQELFICWLWMLFSGYLKGHEMEDLFMNIGKFFGYMLGLMVVLLAFISGLTVVWQLVKIMLSGF